MKIKAAIILLALNFSANAIEVGDEVKCQGYLEEKNQDRVYYDLEGKVLKTLGRHYVVYGYTPVLKGKRLHKVLKISCVLPEQEFIEDVVEIKEEIIEGDELEVVETPVITPIEDITPKGLKAANTRPLSRSKITGTKKSAAPDEHPINENKEDESSTQVEVAAEVKTTKTRDECSELRQKGFMQIIKCFIKDGYGSF